jgi:hypothetical protein
MTVAHCALQLSSSATVQQTTLPVVVGVFSFTQTSILPAQSFVLTNALAVRSQ